VQVEEAFRTLKGDLAVRPIYHQEEKRVEAHIFVAFLAYALHVTLRRRLRDLAPGLTSRAVLEKLRAVPMVDVHLPTTDGREIILTRHTQPDPEIAMILQQLKLQTAASAAPASERAEEVGRRQVDVVKTFRAFRRITAQTHALYPRIREVGLTVAPIHSWQIRHFIVVPDVAFSYIENALIGEIWRFLVVTDAPWRYRRSFRCFWAHRLALS
jgi:hypothetical protein